MSACNACRVQHCYVKSVHLSIRLSNASSVSKRMDIPSYCFNSLAGQHSGFLSISTITKFPGKPPVGGTKYMEVGEFCKYSFLSHKWYEIGQQLLWITNRKSQTADQSVSVAMTLSDLERQGMTGQNFMADLHNYACMVWSRINEFVKVTQVEDKHISMDLTHPNPNGAGPQHPPFYGIPLPMPSLT